MTSLNDMLITWPHFLFTVPPDNSKEPSRPAASSSGPAPHHTEFLLPGAAQPVLPVLWIHHHGSPWRFGGWPVCFLGPSSSDPTDRRWRGGRFVLLIGDNNLFNKKNWVQFEEKNYVGLVLDKKVGLYCLFTLTNILKKVEITTIEFQPTRLEVFGSNSSICSFWNRFYM